MHCHQAKVIFPPDVEDLLAIRRQCLTGTGGFWREIRKRKYKPSVPRGWSRGTGKLKRRDTSTGYSIIFSFSSRFAFRSKNVANVETSTQFVSFSLGFLTVRTKSLSIKLNYFFHGSLAGVQLPKRSRFLALGAVEQSHSPRTYTLSWTSYQTCLCTDGFDVPDVLWTVLLGDSAAAACGHWQSPAAKLIECNSTWSKAHQVPGNIPMLRFKRKTNHEGKENLDCKCCF